MDIRSFFSPKGNTAKPVVSKSGDQRSRDSSKVKFVPEQVIRKARERSKTLSSSEDDEITKRHNQKETKKKKKTRKCIDSDSDEDPLPPKIRKVTSAAKDGSSKPKKSRRNTTFEDSDKEEVVPQKLKKSVKQAETKTSKEVIQVKESPEKVKPTSASDFFGSSPVERASRKVFATKRKQRTDESENDEVPVSNTIEGEKGKSQTVNGKTEKQPSKKRKDDSGSVIDRKKASPQKSKMEDKLPTATPASKLAAKATAVPSSSNIKDTIPETPVGKTKEETSKKANSPTKDDKIIKKESPVKKSPKLSTDNDVPDQVPPSLEKKKSNYRSFMARDGPRALGTKPIPEGEENCLEGLTFVITGVLESIERDDAVDLIQRYGGKVTGSLSKKTNYIVVGRDAGESKLTKAQQFGTTQMDEDGLFNLVKTKPGKKTSYEVPVIEKKSRKKLKVDATKTSEILKQEKEQLEGDSSKLSQQSSSSPALQTPSASPVFKGEQSLMWVDKYRPRSIKQIIGQQGDKSNMRKLMNWLRDWDQNRKKPPSKSSFFKKDQDGSSLKAALLSGSPGVGKTTTATLVCEELGFSYVEMNASDTRNKKTLEEHISQSLSNKTMDGFLSGQKTDPEKHVLIMDEVDGMAGNEDRGGMQELISLIKNSKIPIICMCNDRNSQKIRSLANYCFDLRFQRPRVDQIKGAMMSIAFKEGLKIPPQAMEQIILGANQDVRQVLHNMCMWTAKEKSLNYDQAKADAAKAQKDIKMGPFDAVRKLLSGAESSKMNCNDKSDLFFCDYSMMPLFVQENYLMVEPGEGRGNIKKTLTLVNQTADSISDGDLVGRLIREKGNWSLLPMQAVFSCVIPSGLICGGMGQKIEFPQWLGKNSKRGRLDRILQELQSHMRLSTSSSKLSMNLDYIPHLRKVLTTPLMTQETSEISSGVSRVIQVMADYDLTREDWDSVIEVSQFEGHRDPVASIPSKVKAAFTRTYNKKNHKTPYAIRAAPKKGRRGGANEESQGFDEEGMEPLGEGVEDENDDNDKIENDAMIKATKKQAKAGTSSRGKAREETGKGKGKGRGKDRK
ncbi:replication factor C subunit 1-like [Montipora capricornis]|uniref:replication factor C subunit 1-like n=1 Tax=Montipora capricornis TaxID=246305 RepID=UPI0035F1109F